MDRAESHTVSTDDAYVNGHLTFVAPRVGGQISRVLVDDNNRVHKGDLLTELDKEPYQVAVAQKRAAVDIANADLQTATATARSIEAQAMSDRWKLQRAVQDVDNQSEDLDPFNAAAQSFLGHARAFFLQQTADPVAAQQFAVRELANLRQQQASALTYFDSFWMFAVLTLGLVSWF